MAVTSDARINHPVIAELRALRAAMLDSEWDFFVGCRNVEAAPERWRGDFATFDALLDFGHLVLPSRYRNWCKAVDQLGSNTVRECGVDGSVELVRKAPPAAVVKQAIEHFQISRATNHFPISARQASEVIDRLDTRSKQSGLVAKQEREQTAYEENVLLKRRVLSLEKENARLKEEVATLRERLKAKKTEKGRSLGGARKPAGKSAKRKGSDETRENG